MVGILRNRRKRLFLEIVILTLQLLGLFIYYLFYHVFTPEQRLINQMDRCIQKVEKTPDENRQSALLKMVSLRNDFADKCTVVVPDFGDAANTVYTGKELANLCIIYRKKFKALNLKFYEVKAKIFSGDEALFRATIMINAQYDDNRREMHMRIVIINLKYTGGRWRMYKITTYPIMEK